MKNILLILFTFFSFHALAQNQKNVFVNNVSQSDTIQKILYMTTSPEAAEAFDEFIKKEKFLPTDSPKYAGILKDELRWAVTEKVDLIGKGFKKVSSLEQPTDIKYNIEIMNGLGRFNGIKSQLTKADRIRICQYIIELMDIVALPSSRGQLNMFAYGFDPSTLKAKKK